MSYEPPPPPMPPPPQQWGPPTGQPVEATKKRGRGRTILYAVGGVFAGLVVVAAVFGDPEAEDVAAVEETTTTVEATTTTVEVTTTTETVAAPTTEAETTTTVEATTTTVEESTTTVTLSADDEALIGELAYLITARDKWPVLVGFTDDQLLELARPMCDAAADLDTADEMSLLLALAWERNLEDTSKAVFNNELLQYVEFAGVALGGVCPEEFERLYEG